MAPYDADRHPASESALRRSTLDHPIERASDAHLSTLLHAFYLAMYRRNMATSGRTDSNRNDGSRENGTGTGKQMETPRRGLR